ncbi:DsbA family protein [Natronoglomus mannanivorans]|uniref:DsbA family protein n=1 Tax=Natronoglomus mannanivorans TaxID=2979990 RepID=A0AAP2Z3M5_9EURY|nr:DsbA family protein [Halobacteria archaeon AArc-xg1-1]
MNPHWRPRQARGDDPPETVLTDGGPTRRAVLATISGAATVGVAGCLSDDSRDCSGEQRRAEVPARGDPDSTISIEYYRDFSCGSCATYEAGIVPFLTSNYIDPEIVRYETHDFPVLDEWSWKIPNAAYAVFEETDLSTHVEFTTGVFELQGDYSTESVAELAADLGASPEAVTAAIEDEPYCRQIVDGREEASDRGVDATPTVYVNDRKLEGNEINDIGDVIESERSE